MDDEKVVYPSYEKFAKAGLVNVCVHKGLFPPSVEKQFPHLLAYSDVRDVGKAAKDWPQLNFIIYHSAYRFGGGGRPEDAWTQFEQTGRIEWVTDLAEIPVEVRRHQRLRRPRPDLRPDHGGRAARLRGDDGPARSAASAPTTWCGAPTPSGPARRSGRSRRCAGWRSPRTCRRSTASSRWGPPTARSRRRSSARTTRGCTSTTGAAALATDRLAVAKAAYEESGGLRSNRRYGYVVGARA